MSNEKKHPKIFATLSLDPTTHSYSNSQAPNLNLTLLLDHNEPITIYADDLTPSLMLLCGAFDIHELSTGVEVRQTKRTHCRFPPPSKVEVTLKEHLFHTLQPSVPLTLSAPFSSSGTPRAATDPEYDPGRRHGSCGVDGLLINSRYVLTLASSPRVFWHRVRWWEYGTKEDVLRAGNLNARKVEFGPAPHEPIEVDTSWIRPIEFQCVA